VIEEEDVEKAGYQALEKAMCEIPNDFQIAIRQTYERETAEARRVYDVLFEHIKRQKKKALWICLDSGAITFYVTVGTKAKIRSGLRFWEPLARATKALTSEGILRATAQDPITRYNPNTNIGENMPSLEFVMNPADCIEITAVPKGGGGEVFGSEFRMLLPADGLPGIKKFVLDTATRSAKDGKICPPAVFGIGIGGTTAIAAKLATQAAVLRPIKSRNPIRRVAQLEDELLSAINATGIGPSGHGGKITALDVHIEFSYGHSMALPVAIVPQCIVCHRATATIYSDGSISHSAYPKLWFKRPWTKLKT